MKNIVIEKLTDADNETYLNFVLSIQNSMIYFAPFFHNFLHHSLSADISVIIAKHDKEIIGALPYAEITHPNYGTIFNSLPWYGSHGGCLIKPGAPPFIRKLILEEYYKIFNDNEVLSSTIILTHAEYPFADEYKKTLCTNTFDYRIGQVTFLPPLQNDAEEYLAKIFKQKTRNQMRKSLKQNFRADYSCDNNSWEFLWKTHTDNITTLGGKAKPYAHFVALKNCIPKENLSLAVAYLHGKPIAALLCLIFNKTIEYLTPVILQEFRSYQPLSFLIWHTMKWAVKHGYKYWNWGGTHVSQKTLHHFKAGWGATDMPYLYLTNLNINGYQLLNQFGHAVGDLYPYYYYCPFDLLHHDSAQ